MAERSNRSNDVVALQQAFPNGLTLREIASALKVSRERARQLRNRYASKDWIEKCKARTHERYVELGHTSKRRLSERIDEKIRRLFQAPGSNQQTVEALAREAGTAPSTATRSRRRLGIPLRPPGGKQPYSEADVEQVRLYFESHRDNPALLSDAAAARALGPEFSRVKVGKIRRRELGEKRPRGWPRGRPRK